MPPPNTQTEIEKDRDDTAQQLQRRHGVEPRLSAPAQPQMCDTGRRMHPDGSLFSPAPSSQSPPGLKSLTAQIREREREGERGRARQATHPAGQRRQRGAAWAAGRRRRLRSRSAAGSVLRKYRYERSLFTERLFRPSRSELGLIQIVIAQRRPAGRWKPEQGRTRQGRRGGGCARNACVFSSPFCRT
jgi:hypothetical protein